jgi:3-deoxy-D-manno-octulosonate 8-phosphate phosphatase (KDO 8-P phosphatase)
MIKVLMLDVDGVLSDGGIYYDANGHETKRFDVKDGLGIKLAQKAGIEVIIVSGRVSDVTDLRAAELGITRVFTGVKDKLECYNAIRAELGAEDHECAYMGDDVNDLKLLKKVGLSAAPVCAFEYVRKEVDYITERRAGNGAVREFIEEILKRNGQWENIQKSFY